LPISLLQAKWQPAPEALSSLSKPIRPYVYLFITVVLLTVAEIFLKRGAEATAPAEPDWLGLASLSSRNVWIGATLLTISSVTWIFVLRTMPLYLAFTLCSVIHVTIPVASWLLLDDKISPVRWTGIAMVLAGIWVIARPASRIEERS
jgi:multidrug transporter EmrE-like cation transporter